MGRGKVYLLGAGPGDPELITRRAARRLTEADLVLYDALAHPDLLELCPAEAERVFVGKRAGRAQQRQREITARMIREAQRGRVVARLKGGDPYLFGRGSEEAEALAAAGIEFEVVPGVPSPLAATAYAGISLSHRELASSIAYITATESADKDATAHDWAHLATATQTLVIFMGLRKLDSLMQLLVDHGRPPSCPAAVVQWASLPTQRTVVGTVGDIAERVQQAGLSTPALTIVGEVVRLRERLRWYDTRPLFGKRVLVTRPAEQRADMMTALRDAGAEPVAIEAIRIAEPADAAPLARALGALERYQWLMFTSANAVTRFFDALGRQGGDVRRLGGLRVACIGPATARALRARGVIADVMPDEYRAEALASALPASELAGARVLLPRAARARDVLPETLRGFGAQVDVVEAYRTLPADETARKRLRARLRAGELDVVTFTSSSTVQHTLEAVGGNQALAGLTIASIGPITSDTATRAGLPVHVTASRYTVPGLVDALTRHFAEND